MELTNRTLGINSLSLSPFNCDHDGDVLNLLMLHSKDAQNEYQNIFFGSMAQYEHTGDSLIEFRHEAVFALYKLTTFTNPKEPILIIDTLESLPHNIDYIKEEAYIRFNDTIYPYTALLINKMIGLNKIVYDASFAVSKKTIKRFYKLIFNACANSIEYHDAMYRLQLFILECATLIDNCILTYKYDDFDINTKHISYMKSRIVNEPVLGMHQQELIYKQVLLNLNIKDNNSLLELLKSGARLNREQFMRAAVLIGFPADSFNRVNNVATKKSLLDGLSPLELFTISDGARKALSDREISIPKSGEYQRRIMLQAGFLKLDFEKEDCGTERLLPVTILNDKHIFSLTGRYFKRHKDDVYDIVNNNIVVGEKIYIRTPMLCEHGNFKICKKCFGKQLPTSEHIGILIGQYISEMLLQSILRAHHTGGSASIDLDDTLLDLIQNEKIELYVDDQGSFIKDNGYHIGYINQVLTKYYDTQIELEPIEVGSNIYKLEIPHMIQNQDAVASLEYIIGVMHSNDAPDLLLSYKQLLGKILTIKPMYSSYVEALLSLTFFNSEDVNMRYIPDLNCETFEQITKQISLNDIVTMIDPKLILFYRMNKKSLFGLYNNTNNIDHTYLDLLKFTE